jgi:hypothetical protein
MAVSRNFFSLDESYPEQWGDSLQQFHEFLKYCETVVEITNGINLDDVKELKQVPPHPVSHTQLSLVPQGPMGMGVSFFFYFLHFSFLFFFRCKLVHQFLLYD